ncbi:(4Fe-4S)-binding protein [Paraconexibacter sp.]|uniref:(4Fe-4S)-binding protein n=1 Tax=Paraconexibacter sp. TaxID=2949640 RepID=UPI0035696474
MSGENTRKRYSGDGIVVTFDGTLCRHAAECVRGLPEVFDTKARPWIQPANAAPDVVTEVVARCPSGALRTERPS